MRTHPPTLLPRRSSGAAVLALLALLGSLPGQASRRQEPPKAPPTFRVVEDEQYATTSRDGRRNRLDLYLPAAADAPKPPLVMFVHGGGWMGGSKELHRGLGEAFAQRGFACAVINYRLAPIAKFPDHVDDCAAAFAWLRAHADEHGFDRERMFVMGHSAGGHLVSLLAFDDALLQAHGLDAGMIRGVVSLSGVYDVRMPHPLLEKVFGKQPRDRARASPTVLAHRQAPPFFVRWAEHDLPGLQLSASLFAARLRKLDVAIDAAELRGEDHAGYVYRFGGERDVVGPDLLRFLHDHAEPVPPAPAAAEPRK